MRKRIVQIFLCLLILTSAAIALNYITAQTNPPALVLHPSNFDLTLTPGSPTKGSIFLMNTTTKTLTIQTSLRNFTAQGEEGGVNITAENTPFSLASWITVTPEKVDVPSGKEVRFDYTINPPANAEPGGHFGSIVFGTVPSAVNNTGSAVSQEIAALILGEIPGNVKEDAVIESITTDKNFYEFGPVHFTLRVKNNGDVHIAPFGAVEVTDMLGRKFDAPLDPTNVLPNSIRRINATFAKRLLIGPYQAKIIASYGSKNLPLVGSVTFYAFPVRYAGVALVILLIIFLLRKRLWKSFKALVLNK
jgi:hypothetical protein